MSAMTFRGSRYERCASLFVMERLFDQGPVRAAG